MLDQIKGWTSETWKTWVLDPHGQLVSVNRIPPYATSLDAIAQAEAGLTLAQREPYQQWLYRICEREHRMAPIYWLAITATALQRSTALLHTVGLWKEEA